MGREPNGCWGPRGCRVQKELHCVLFSVGRIAAVASGTPAWIVRLWWIEREETRRLGGRTNGAVRNGERRDSGDSGERERCTRTGSD